MTWTYLANIDHLHMKYIPPYATNMTRVTGKPGIAPSFDEVFSDMSIAMFEYPRVVQCQDIECHDILSFPWLIDHDLFYSDGWW